MIKHMYPQHVTALFQKALNENNKEWLSYETRLADQWGNEDAISVTLSIDDLIYKEDTSEWWITHQPNAIKLLKGKKANLVMFYGLGDGIAKDTKQEITINKDGNVFVLWRIENLEFLNGVANALKGKGNVWIKMDLFCDDNYFDDYENTKSYSVNLYKISINFADKEV